MPRRHTARSPDGTPRRNHGQDRATIIARNHAKDRKLRNFGPRDSRICRMPACRTQCVSFRLAFWVCVSVSSSQAQWDPVSRQPTTGDQGHELADNPVPADRQRSAPDNQAVPGTPGTASHSKTMQESRGRYRRFHISGASSRDRAAMRSSSISTSLLPCIRILPLHTVVSTTASTSPKMRCPRKLASLRGVGGR